jgi:hypothetical protein
MNRWRKAKNVIVAIERKGDQEPDPAYMEGRIEEPSDDPPYPQRQSPSSPYVGPPYGSSGSYLTSQNPPPHPHYGQANIPHLYGTVVPRKPTYGHSFPETRSPYQQNDPTPYSPPTYTSDLSYDPQQSYASQHDPSYQSTQPYQVQNSQYQSPNQASNNTSQSYHNEFYANQIQGSPPLDPRVSPSSSPNLAYNYTNPSNSPPFSTSRTPPDRTVTHPGLQYPLQRSAPQDSTIYNQQYGRDAGYVYESSTPESYDVASRSYTMPVEHDCQQSWDQYISLYDL